MFYRVPLMALLFCGGGAIAADSAALEIARRTGLSATEIQQKLANCDESPTNLSLCAEHRFIKADIVLAQVYRELAGRREERSAGSLRRAQTVWIALRDKNCEYESSDLDGGTLRAAVSLNCKRRMTEDRIEWVREMLSCTSIRGECRSAKPVTR
jgi:uncharacterized protein YecT (DUF1311 family)